jgi:hypothetical protein
MIIRVSLRVYLLKMKSLKKIYMVDFSYSVAEMMTKWASVNF